MIDSATTDLPEAASPNQPSEPDGLAELRNLLVGPEQTQLIKLRERLDNPQVYAREVSRILPDAITLRSTKDAHLTQALLPTVEEAIQVSVEKNPKVLVDALFPVMGPAIRKAIAEALSGMLQTLNQTLEHSLSPRSLKWRLQAWRTGKSFAEILLLNTLLYRVEQVFLIHKETSLLLHQVTARSVAAQDADLVSGMLTAIQDFVRDSFNVPQGETLDTVQVGELTVWLEQGPQAILAGVIRGTAPPDLRLIFKDAIENIHRAQSHALEAFAGDAAPFEATRPDLEACLRSQYAAQGRRISPALWITAGAILVALGIWAFFAVRDQRRWANYLKRLRTEPGIVVTTAERGWSGYYIAGLRDPLAADPARLLQDSGLDLQQVTSRWEPYQALSPQFVLTRARALLEPPETVTLKVENATLYASGTAPPNWLLDARKLARAIAGITGFNADQLRESGQIDLAVIRQRIEKQVLHFAFATSELVADQDAALRDLAADIRQLDHLAAEAGKAVSIEIAGHTDKSGSEASRLRLSQDRAHQIERALMAQGINQARLTTVGLGDKAPLREELTEQDKAFNRSVSFKVMLTDLPKRKAP
jgi:OOP family OmpA-OmpF porin